MEELYNIQKRFTDKILVDYGVKHPITYADKVRLTKEYILSLHSECDEVLEQLNWKSHRTENKELNIDNVYTELIDVQKYLWGLMYIWGMDVEVISKIFTLKSLEVERRWIQDKELSNNKDNICLIDIDGVLNNYPICFYDWVLSTYNKKYSEFINNPVEYERYKHLYRSSDAKSKLQVIPSSIEALDKLKLKKYKIILFTNRPFSKYFLMYSYTLQWLSDNSIPYDYLLSSENRKIIDCKGINNIKFIIDDNKDTCSDFKALGIKAYQFGVDIRNIKEIEELK